jgi:hypothetical protein
MGRLEMHPSDATLEGRDHDDDLCYIGLDAVG